MTSRHIWSLLEIHCRNYRGAIRQAFAALNRGGGSCSERRLLQGATATSAAPDLRYFECCCLNTITTIYESNYGILLFSGECYLNFVEVMALYRAFSVGRFKCACTSPKITVADFQSEGYVLKIPKSPAEKFCLSCIKDFSKNKGLIVTENGKYLTIHSP
jgi:hypothetical protein